MPMQLNTLMSVSYVKTSNWNSLTPPKELKQLVHSGFIEVESCCFLKYLYHKETNVSPADFPDKTGLECFINSFHLEDYVEENWLPYALWVINQLFEKYANLFNHNLLTAIVTQDDLSCTLRFHLKREEESWLDEDLDSYKEEAILVIDSNERPSLSQVVSRTKTKRNVPLLVEQPVWLETG
jgi:hypothetical protein